MRRLSTQPGEWIDRTQPLNSALKARRLAALPVMWSPVRCWLMVCR